MPTPIEWPAGLPDCPQTWSETPAPDIVRSDMDVGPAKTRRRSTLENTVVQVSVTLKAEQYNDFMNFYNNQISFGVTPFYYKHPITAQINTYHFLENPKIDFIPGPDGVGYISIAMQWEKLE